MTITVNRFFVTMTMWIPTLDPAMPRYRALAEAIRLDIAAGQLKDGERLPPQRRLADALGVTIGTVTRGYAEAERSGLVSARVGSGTYINGATRSAHGSFSSFGHALRASKAYGLAPEQEGALPAASGVIDLTMSLPPPHPARQQGMAAALAAISQSPEALLRSVEYQNEFGDGSHRQLLASWMGELGMPVDPEELMLTQGGQNGITLALSALLAPGDAVVTGALTYPGLIVASAERGLKLLRVPLDKDGMDVEALARLCRQQAPRMVYVMAEQNNPGAAQLSHARREALVALARQHDFWILEDGVQYLPDEECGTRLYQMAPERTLYVFSTSKLLAGGLRLGVLRAPVEVLTRIGAVLRSHSWMVAPLLMETVCAWLTSGNATQLVAWQMEEMRARQRLARTLLAEWSPAARPSSFDLWLELPEGQRSQAMVASLAERGVHVTSAEPFCVGNEPPPQAIRLCLSAAESREALTHALEIVREQLQAPPTLRPMTL